MTSPSFELKRGGRALVRIDHAKPVAGKWHAVEGGIELDFGIHKDIFKLEADAQPSTLRYDQSLVRTFVKSPLKLEAAYVLRERKR
jgi:hypothetical protein